MKNMGILGAVLIVLGVGALFFGHFSYTDTKPDRKSVGRERVSSPV